MTSPYENLPLTAFWRSGVCATPPTDMKGIFKKKWEIKLGDRVATAGSCFAQHISRYMRKNKFSVMDVELAPPELPFEEHEKWGYGLYSARYGNIYTVHQLLQLAKESFGVIQPKEIVWEKNGRFYDALRPSVNPLGFASAEDVYKDRASHILAVKEMFLDVDIFVFTLGLTEAWVHRASNIVFPTAPETIAGVYDKNVYSFKNFNFIEIVEAFEEFLKLLHIVREERPQIKILLTVSPVPLTATAEDKHVLLASTYSKSVLRAVAGYLSDKHPNIDYFPSYEIITNPATKSGFYEENLRTVKSLGVESVMNVFFEAHRVESSEPKENSLVSSTKVLDDDVQCEDVLLEAFANSEDCSIHSKELLVFIGDSHISGLKECVEKYYRDYQKRYRILYIPVSWLAHPLVNLEGHKYLTSLEVKAEYKTYLPNMPTPDEMRGGTHICFVGVGLLGDGVIRAFGAMNAGGTVSQKDKSCENPQLPILGVAEEIEKAIGKNTLVSEIENYDDLQKNHIHPLNIRINIFNGISGSGIYRSVHWVASPDMVERTARFRFGDAYVNSLSHMVHKRVAEAYVDEYNSRNKKQFWLIKHDNELSMKNGFTKDRYAFNDSVNDIHTNAEFYVGALSRYFSAIS